LRQRYKDAGPLSVFSSDQAAPEESRTFFGRSENAVKNPTVVCADCLFALGYSRKTSGFKGTLWASCGSLRSALFQRLLTDKTSYERLGEQAQIERERLQMGCCMKAHYFPRTAVALTRE